MDNSTRRGPSGFFMALLGICALALLVVMIYGVAVSNPDMVKQLMGVTDQTDEASGGDMGYYDMTGDMSGDMTGDMAGDMTGDMAGDADSGAETDAETDGDAAVDQPESAGAVSEGIIAVG